MKGTRPDPETLAWMIAFSKQQVRELREQERKDAMHSSTSSRKSKAARPVKLRATKGSGRKTASKTGDARQVKVAV